MTTTLRATSVDGATLKATALTHEEMDANFLFTQSGSGASTTTVQDEIRARARPEQFGAVGNGSTLDTTALTNVTASARIVEFAADKTYFTGTFSPVTGCRLQGGSKSIIKIDDDGAAANPSLYLNGVADVVIDGLTFTSDATSRTGVYGLIRIAACSRVRVINCKFLTSASVAIYVENSNDILIQGNEVGDGTLFTYADGIHINRQSSRVRIIGNTLRGCRDDAIGVISAKDGATYTANVDVVVEGNTILGTTTAGSGISVVGGIGIVVKGNVCRGTFVENGITVAAGGDATYNSGTNIIVDGNVCMSATLNGISIGGLNRGVVNNNVCASNTLQGIQIAGTSLNVTCNGNVCHGNGDYGIYEESGSGPNIFIGNALKDNTQAAGKLINGGTSSVDDNNLT